MTQQLIEWRFDSSDAPDMLDFASGYGTTWVSESFVRRTLHKEISEYSCMRLPRGLNGHAKDCAAFQRRQAGFGCFATWK